MLQEKGAAMWERENDVVEAIGEEEESVEGRGSRKNE